jgi:hypothetical protein
MPQPTDRAPSPQPDPLERIPYPLRERIVRDFIESRDRAGLPARYGISPGELRELLFRFGVAADARRRGFRGRRSFRGQHTYPFHG